MLGVLVISALMIPVTMEFADEIHSTEANNDATSYNLNSTNKKVELEIVDGFGYINGDRIGVGFSSNMIMFTDSFIIIYSAGNAGNIDTFYLYSDTLSTSITEILLNDGEWTATKADGSEISGTYSWVMKYAENGNYFRVNTGVTTYVDADAPIYIAIHSGSDAGLWSGKVNRFDNVFKNNIEITDPSITYSSYTTTPEVFSVTGINGGTLFVPVKYSVITPMDNMTKTIVGLSPLFVGIALFAVMGVGLVRINGSK